MEASSLVLEVDLRDSSLVRKRRTRQMKRRRRTSSYVFAFLSANLSRPRSPLPVHRTTTPNQFTSPRAQRGEERGREEQARRTARKELDNVHHLPHDEIGEELDEDDEENEELRATPLNLNQSLLPFEGEGRREKEEGDRTHQQRPPRNVVSPPFPHYVFSSFRTAVARHIDPASAPLLHRKEEGKEEEGRREGMDEPFHPLLYGRKVAHSGDLLHSSSSRSSSCASVG